MALFNIIKTLKALEVPVRYRVSLDTLLVTVIPVELRRPVLKAWLASLASPLVSLYTAFLVYMTQTRRELSYNGQTMALERALNDLFDPTLVRIYIVGNDDAAEATYDNFVDEEQPWQYMTDTDETPPWFYDYDFTEFTNQVGFTVKVPASLRPKEFAINARIKQLKLAMIKHSISYI